MKKIVIGVCSLIIILLLLLIGLGLVNNNKEKKESQKIEESFQQIKEVKYDEILSKEGNQLYYYYQPNCGYCNELKPTIVEFYSKLDDSTNVSFNRIDMSKEENEEGWYDWDAHHEKYGTTSDDPKDNPNYKFEAEDLQTVNDVKISGTPSIVYVKDGKIQEFKIGNNDIMALLDNISKENKIDFNI